jgi:hypothetical protein
MCTLPTRYEKCYILVAMWSTLARAFSKRAIFPVHTTGCCVSLDFLFQFFSYQVLEEHSPALADHSIGGIPA